MYSDKNTNWLLLWTYLVRARCSTGHVAKESLYQTEFQKPSSRVMICKNKTQHVSYTGYHILVLGIKPVSSCLGFLEQITEWRTHVLWTASVLVSVKCLITVF